MCLLNKLLKKVTVIHYLCGFLYELLLSFSKLLRVTVRKLGSVMLGVVDYLTTEISSSKQKKFPLLTFIDTPGLVDGDMVYPFDVNKTLVWFGKAYHVSLRPAYFEVPLQTFIFFKSR